MKYRAPSLAVALGALLVTLAGCRDSTSPFEPPGEPPVPVATRILPASPTAFHAPPGSRVTAPAVIVLDQFGKAMANRPIHYTIVRGGGFVANRVVATDAEGRATAGSWVLGAEPGENHVVARAEGLVPVAFMARGGLEPVYAAYGLVRINDDTVPHAGVLGGYYILYEDGTFVRGYVSGSSAGPIGSRLEAGVFSRADTVITFEREGYSWTGILRDEHLIAIDYNDLSAEVYAVTPRFSPPGEFPPVARPATIYNRQTPHSHPSGALSRYVLYEDGAFGLQYGNPMWGFHEYPGRYSRADSVITFNFDGWNSAGPWQADGVVHGDSLFVRYNDVMLWSDFEDGVYVRSSGTP
jgi:hypothetical protein